MPYITYAACDVRPYSQRVRCYLPEKRLPLQAAADARYVASYISSGRASRLADNHAHLPTLHLDLVLNHRLFAQVLDEFLRVVK